MVTGARTGIQIQILLGAFPRPMSVPLTAALLRVEVTENSNGPTGFQIVFDAGRGGPGHLGDGIIGSASLAPFSRVIIIVRMGLLPVVLVRGVITHRQLVYDQTDVVAVTGEDMTVMMDLAERVVAHPAMGEAAIATEILTRYSDYGIVPQVVTPTFVDQPVPAERVPVQHSTDLAYLRLLAARVHHVFALIPSPAIGSSIGYWGPAVGLGRPPLRPLPPLSVQTDGARDVRSLTFEHATLDAARVTGRVTDAKSGRAMPILAAPLAVPGLAARIEVARRTLQAQHTGGLTAAAARARAQATADASTDRVVTATGELDVAGYRSILRSHRLVGVRGAGSSCDGLYQVDSVTHLIEQGGYRQKFTLVRPGVGTTALVLPTSPLGR